MELTLKDTEKLDKGVRPLRGSPFQLGIEHYFELSRIRDEVVRSWYEYKTAMKCLSLRQLRRIIHEDLFEKIIGRPVPKPPRKKIKKGLPKTGKAIAFSPEAEAEYQKLRDGISAIITKTEAKGIPMRHVRHEILECKACGAYEDYLLEGPQERTAFDRSGKRIEGEFQVVKSRETSRDLEGGGTRCALHYEFICGSCGAFQKTKVEEDFED